jgi:hypothetical protein
MGEAQNGLRTSVSDLLALLQRGDLAVSDLVERALLNVTASANAYLVMTGLGFGDDDTVLSVLIPATEVAQDALKTRRWRPFKRTAVRRRLSAL